MKIPNINCVHFRDFGRCNIRTWLKFFRKSCIEIDFNKSCDQKEKYPKPIYSPKPGKLLSKKDR
jgi:hypothetical protein